MNSLEASLVCPRRGIDVDVRRKVHPIIFVGGVDVLHALVDADGAWTDVVAAAAVEAGADASAAGDISPPVPVCYSSCRQAPTVAADDSRVPEEGEAVDIHPLQLLYGLNPKRIAQEKDKG